MAARSRVTGHRETAANLRALARYSPTPVSEASRKALAPTLAEARANAPVDTGALRKSLVVRKARSPRDQPQHMVGPRRGSDPVRYAHLTEFGRAPGADGSGGITGLRWLTAAFESTKGEVVKLFGQSIGPAIEKLAAKVRR